MRKGLIWVLLIVMSAGCVPVRQFNTLKKKNKELETQVHDLTKENIKQTNQNTELKSMIQRLTRMLQEMRNDSTARVDELNAATKKFDDISRKYNDLVLLNDRSVGDKEARDLLSHLQLLQEQLQKREDALRLAEFALQSQQDSLKNAKSSLLLTQQELDARNRRLIHLEKTLATKDSAMNELKKLISDALIDFNNDQLKVHIKNGKVYVSMEEKLLFGSGSYDVSAQGVSALTKIATVLAKNKEINITVEGHTDDVPYLGSGKLLDNWDLSAKRSTSVTRILLANKAIDGKRISASGRSSYLPLLVGKTPEARQKNRRTEIILTPNLDKLLEILDSNQ